MQNNCEFLVDKQFFYDIIYLLHCATNPCGAIRHNVQKEVQEMAVTANYETVMIVSMKKGEEGIQAIVEKFKALIEKNATLKNVDEWGKRKLAYLINKESEGYYVLFDFESTAEFPAELDRIYKITEGVMRSMIIRKEDE